MSSTRKNHPAALKAKKVYAAEDFVTLQDKQKITLAGAITIKNVRSSPRGRYASLTLSDPTGVYECAVFNGQLLNRCGDMPEPGNMVLITALVRKDEGGMRLMADDISEINEDFTYVGARYRADATYVAQLETLAKELQTEKPGKDTIHATVTIAEHPVTLHLGDTFRMNPAALPTGVDRAD